MTSFEPQYGEQQSQPLPRGQQPHEHQQGYPPQQQGHPGQQPYPPQQYGYPPQAGYGAAPYGSPRRGTNTMAILAIIFGFVFPPLGVVFGFIGRSQIRTSGEDGDGLALAGIIIGGIITALYVIGLILFFVLLGTAANTIGNIDFSNFPTGT